ncbi:MAG: hypothetical protein NPIRA02_16210 [Nitrospirales bacterium]|nr:MAG: hypothetical protein NPIRA02_16210 [Nitrospirales bacterium]
MVVKAIKIMLYPREYVKRKLLTRQLRRYLNTSLRISECDGYCTFNVHSLPYGTEVLELCEQIFQKRCKSNLSETNQIEGKPWRRNLLYSTDFNEHTELLQFACSNEVLAIVSTYLGTIPEIGNIQLWWTQVNDATESSQLFHIDQEDFRQAKMFVHVTDVDHSSGPFTLVKAKAARNIERRAASPYNRISDDEVMTLCSTDAVIPLIGPSGTAAFVDTSRCYHFGSRSRGRDRVVLVITYIPFHHIMEPTYTLLQRKNLLVANLPEFARWALPA